ncbi:transport protein particle component [Wallemia mellicola CBS 633.66]|uniref:Transport protein particle component n=1 Tax=Wallemia mellicola (strain ATCC MYA-4683 / CBS 633.66) TaxID=671144 RepID=I4Y6T3_WALMC|nr:transport protein particle component [Wallemia mellicola CBS 633.66]EIM19675.1 transport protein particle component [Wallemia mellicola CBS 633.66]|eukprot:XP_006960336.1 transport protein particle component [Wallemia mellicola CBS 633.66]
MSKSSLNLSRNSASNARSSTSVDNNVAVDSVLNDLLTIELIPTLRTSTEEEMKRDDRDITEESVDEELTKKLKHVGTSIGHTVAERIKQTREPLNDNLEVIKLLCKEIWTFIYGKQLDNLRTNHKGTFVLHDNSYRPLVNLSSSDESASKRMSIFLSIQLGIIQGCLSAFNLSSQVSCDVSALPGCTFQVKLVD